MVDNDTMTRAREMVEWLKVLTALTETLSSLLSTQIWQFMAPAQVLKIYSMGILVFWNAEDIPCTLALLKGFG